jgi:outer membrane lipoprotein-sorting protein
MRILLLLMALNLTATLAQTPDGKEIIRLIDKNMSADTRVLTSRMIIHGRRSTRNLESKSWISGEDKSYTEYLYPAREQGTKMLKLEDQLWIYSPSSDRTILIAGHMLRQSVMGSDMSYEDLMEDKKLTDHYNAEVTGTAMLDNRECWVLVLTAFDPAVAYQTRKLWVDTERNVPLREELYAKGGTLLKRTELSDIERISGRWYPRKVVFKDMLKDGDGTEFITESIEFNIKIDDYVFSKANLKK